MVVGFELIFSPSFFNIMTHLLVHLVKEIDILRPVFLHNMFPFERFMGVLKKCVRNRARPEGSIASAYGTEEVIDFCVDFIDDLKLIRVSESRYKGRLDGKGTLRKKSFVCTDDFSFKKAHYTVLQQSSLVDPYIKKHMKILLSEFPEKSEAWITRELMNTFRNQLPKVFMCSRVIHASDFSGNSEIRIFLCSSICGSTKDDC